MLNNGPEKNEGSSPGVLAQHATGRYLSILTGRAVASSQESRHFLRRNLRVGFSSVMPKVPCHAQSVRETTPVPGRRAAPERRSYSADVATATIARSCQIAGERSNRTSERLGAEGGRRDSAAAMREEGGPRAPVWANL